MADSARNTSPRGRQIFADPAGSGHHRADSDVSAVSPSRASVTARLATPIVGSPSASVGPSRSTPTSRTREDDSAPLAGASGAASSGPGSSSLSRALRGSFGTHSPTRGSLRRPQGLASAADVDVTPDQRSPAAVGPAHLTPQPSMSQLGRSPRPEDIEILKRHLVNPSQTGSEPGSFRRGGKFPADSESVADNDEFSSLQLQGGDTTRHIYRYAQKMEEQQADSEGRETGRLRRSKSVTLKKTNGDEEGGISSISIPGGFRREHIRRAAASPAPSNARREGNYGAISGVVSPPRPQPRFVASNFIEFLTLYGHFAGEVLEEDDEVLGPDEYFSSDANDESATGAEDSDSDDGHGEHSALLRGRNRRRRRIKPRESGKGTPFGAAMLLLKSFVGTGVLFLPRAYLNGGMVFSNLVLLFVAVLSYYCFILLVNTRLKVHASFGDMGAKIFGNYFRNMINFSLVISQIGFTSAYIVFVSENLQAFVLAITNCRTHLDVGWFILMQTAIFLPLSLYRNINHIQKMALTADLFIALGLIYLYYYDVKTIVDHRGVADIKAFNPRDWTLFIGTAIFTFEGVGLVIPIQSGMKQPNKFPKVLAVVMVVISVVFISAGAVSYAAYGSKTKTVILLNFPQDSKLVNSVQFLYSIAILLSTPLQLYPAIEITSQQLFSRTGKYNPWIKWKKNIFRFFMVALCSAIAYAGANDLDKFVALVGSFACIPLVYIYPPLMHYRVVATQTWQKVANIALVVFGFGIMAYSTAQTAIQWAHGHQEKSPGYCDR